MASDVHAPSADDGHGWRLAGTYSQVRRQLPRIRRERLASTVRAARVSAARPYRQPCSERVDGPSMARRRVSATAGLSAPA